MRVIIVDTPEEVARTAAAAHGLADAPAAASRLELIDDYETAYVHDAERAH